MASFDTLSDAEIRAKLFDLGCEVGPVTPSTRRVYVKKLQSIVEKGGSGGQSKEREKPPPPSPEDTIFKNRRKSPVQSRPRKKSPSRGSEVHPLASSTFVDTNSSAKPNILKSSILSENTRPAPRDLTPPEKRVSSSTVLISSPEEHPSFRPSYNLPSPSYNGRSKFNSPSYMNDSSFRRTKLPDFDPDQPYASDFTRRLSNSSVSRIAAQTTSSPRTPLSNSKIYDSVKESDDEEDSSGPVYGAKFGTSSRGSLQQSRNGEVYPPGGGWLGRDASVYILGFLAMFFVVVAYAYIHMHQESHVATYIPELAYPRCTGFNQNCIPEHEMQKATAVFKLLTSELNDLASRRACTEDAVPSICVEEASKIINMKDSTLSVYELDTYVHYAGILANSNPSKNVLFGSKDGFRLRETPTSMFCSLVKHTVSLTFWIVRIGIGLLFAGSVYGMVKWWMIMKSKRQEEVLKMFTQIVDLVSSTATHEAPGFAVISHVRDRLIPAVDKSSKSKVWDEAVALLEADSRVRTEVQQVEGEDFLVWRWLAPPPNPKKKVWQGQAFETMDGSVNSLPESPTACLKIRHMFDPSQEEGDNWTTAVADAVLEKCKDATIYHIVVEKLSPEGCVYVKCASPRDAGIAYRALHGFWFDSKLVTVKYIREARYLERFPDSARAKYPLVPSSKRQN